MSAAPAPDPGPETDARGALVRRGAGAALVLVLVALGIAALVTAFAPKGGTTTIAPGPTAPTGIDVAASSALFVHILGEVERPGLYELREGARAVDVVAAAGGFTDAADPGALNLARLVVDGEQIVVPAVGETPAVAPGLSADGRVNLNTADAAMLETLPRIGPAMADRILSWREQHGPFRAIEDLLEISGIGDATFDALRDLVTV